MFCTSRHLQSPTGARLAYRHEPSRGHDKGVVLISHGLAEHSRRYQAFAERLAAEGFHVYAHDHRGHGDTTAPDAPIGRFAHRHGLHLALDDMAAIRELAVAAHPGLPIILFGHSMGGLFALLFAETHPQRIDGLAVWNCNLNPGFAGRAAQAVLLAERMLKGSDVPSEILPKLTFAAWAKKVLPRRTDFDWLSHDAAEVDRYIADPLCGFDASVSLWLDVFAMTFAAAKTDAIARLPSRLPIHLVGGNEDPATDFGRAVTWLGDRLTTAGLSDVTCLVHRGLRHETLLERQDLREMPIADFCNWCQRIAQTERRTGRSK
ncbi:alpha-beta hydrolase superfamily lysophospholipase [Mycoplana sp. BE70]|uniref:alpha/beta hydrolase n=1 Tax=Mycoplana sp. BE70 TaxID=2817775 RepID=UPI002866FB27|nr:alpha/beta hydrolase [Mycoplana sp. BE70]MDR6756667.1 alpha-beta hydrolase superfamily lysophospholipase [Mycoplana sp. BE70]